MILGVSEKLEETRQDIMTKPALPSSTGCQSTFTGLRTGKLLKETALDRRKLGVVIKKPKLVCDYSSSSSESDAT